MIPLEKPLRRGTNLLWLLELPGRHAPFELLQRQPRPLHRLLAHRLLVLAALLGIDDDHPHTRDSRRDFLRSRSWWIGLLLRCDSHWAVDPLGLVDRLQPSIELLVPPPLQPYQIAMAARGYRFKIITGDHASIADEDEALEPKSLVQVGNGLADGRVVDFIAGPNVMRDRPARDHHHGNDHLNVIRLAVTA